MLDKLKKRISFVASKMSMANWVVYKLCLVVFGLILGVYFSEFLMEYVQVLWVFWLALFIYMTYVFLGDLYQEDNEKNGSQNNDKK